MPPYVNPMNDFYFRNSLPQVQYNFPQKMPQVNVRFVTSVDEAKAAMIDGFSTNLFLDSGNGKIYLKKMNNNGLSDFIVYAIEGDKQVEKDPIEDIKERLSAIESRIGGNNEPIPVRQSTEVSRPAVAEPYERNDETQPAGLPARY